VSIFTRKKFLETYTVQGKEYLFYDLAAVASYFGKDITAIPYSIRVLVENIIRNASNDENCHNSLKKIFSCPAGSDGAFTFYPGRILMQDFTGVPAIVDLATLRDAVFAIGKDPEVINPSIPVDLVIDHSLIVDSFGTKTSFEENIYHEYQRNKERYQFLKWGQKAFKNFRVVPPGAGICHQVNLEYLAPVVSVSEFQGGTIAFPDTLVGTDSHTTMINALGVLGWGVGGIEAEAAMLGQGYPMQVPEVVGVHLSGGLRPGVTATDLVLTITEVLRKHNVVSKFVEFYGAGLECLSLADRATIANMAPEYGATCGFFPVDSKTLAYLKLTGRSGDHVDFVEQHCRQQNLFWSKDVDQPLYNDTVEINLAQVETSLAGPLRPQQRLNLGEVSQSFRQQFVDKESKSQLDQLSDGSVVIAAITSCTNTSNPAAMIGAGLIAKKARELGLMTKPWVKTSLAPGSQVVTDYLEKAGLQSSLDELGFDLVGYGCTTCIGNSGPLNPEIESDIIEKKLVVASVLSGNRNFSGRVSPLTQLNYLASPMLVVAYALMGSVDINLEQEAIGYDQSGNAVYLRDIWPTHEEIQSCVDQSVSTTFYRQRYEQIFLGDQEWRSLKVDLGSMYAWDEKSTYIKKAPYFDNANQVITYKGDIIGARALLVLGDSVTTDHISPAGSIQPNSPAGQYLLGQGVPINAFNSYGARRGNHEVMVRGTFANVRLQNEMVPDKVGGYTYGPNKGEGAMAVYDAAMGCAKHKTPLVVIAGKEYGTGSSRDWAAKGSALLGIKAVIAESFERIHRSNLIGMGVLPLMFPEDVNRKTLGITGFERFDLVGLNDLSPGGILTMRIHFQDGQIHEQELLCRIDTAEELNYFKNGGILPSVLSEVKGADLSS
tara:strand:+ start:25594 stop:28251 length:2658 start_codon:yes stop_codon:yes gene_type:complete